MAPISERAPLLAAKEANLSASSWKHAKTLAYSASAVFVVLVGCIASMFSDRGVHDGPKGEEDVFEWRSQTLGWLSAFLYSTS